MGFCGSVLLARSERPLTELAEVAALSSTMSVLAQRDDGWQIAGIEAGGQPVDQARCHGLAECVTTIAQVTGAQALIASGCDTSAFLTANSPYGHAWAAWLNRGGDGWPRALRGRWRPPDITGRWAAHAAHLVNGTTPAYVAMCGLNPVEDTAGIAAQWAAGLEGDVDADLMEWMLTAADIDRVTAHDELALAMDADDLGNAQPVIVEIHVIRLIQELGVLPQPVDPTSWWAQLVKTTEEYQ